MRGKVTKTEKILLLAAGVFLCVLLGFFLRDRQIANSGQVLVETQYAAAASEVTPAEVTEKVNINTATAEQLQELPGIGKELAGRIVEYRTEHGDFQTIADIQDVSGIGEGKYEEIREFITTGEKKP